MPRGKYEKPSALTALEVGSRVWIYVRVSSEQQADRETPIEGQISELRRFAEQHGWVVERVFADEAQGGSYDQREAFQQMIEESKRRPRPVDGILVWNFSRFARDQLDAQFYKADLRRRGYILISYSDDIPAGDFSTVIEAFIDWKNQRYLEDLSKDVKRGLRMVAERGYAPGGFPPRGYKAERVQVGTKRNGEPRYNSKWMVDERLRDKVTMAWQMAADSASYREIHRATNLFKNATCYNAFFQNKTYIGIRKCGQVEVPGAHEPLVTQDLFNKVQEMLFGKQRVGVHPRRVRSPYLLSGLAFCGYCGSALNGGYDPRREDLTFYKCGLKWRNGGGACPSSRISAKVLENTALDALRDSIFSGDNIDLLVQEVNQELSKLISNVGARRAELEARLDAITKAVANLVSVVEEHGQVGNIVQRIKERELEKQELLLELEDLRQAERRNTPLFVDRKTIEPFLSNLRTTLNSGSPSERSAFLKAFVTRIDVWKEHGEISYRFPPEKLTVVWQLPPREFESLFSA